MDKKEPQNQNASEVTDVTPLEPHERTYKSTGAIIRDQNDTPICEVFTHLHDSEAFSQFIASACNAYATAQK